MLLHGDKTLPEKKRHFTAKQCRDELHMKYVQVYFTELKLNDHLVEDALQSRLQCYPLGVRLWREVAKGHGEKAKPPEEDVVFVTYSHHVHAATNEGVCYVSPYAHSPAAVDVLPQDRIKPTIQQQELLGKTPEKWGVSRSR